MYSELQSPSLPLLTWPAASDCRHALVHFDNDCTLTSDLQKIYAPEPHLI